MADRYAHSHDAGLGVVETWCRTTAAHFAPDNRCPPFWLSFDPIGFGCDFSNVAIVAAVALLSHTFGQAFVDRLVDQWLLDAGCGVMAVAGESDPAFGFRVLNRKIVNDHNFSNIGCQNAKLGNEVFSDASIHRTSIATCYFAVAIGHVLGLGQTETRSTSSKTLRMNSSGSNFISI